MYKETSTVTFSKRFLKQAFLFTVPFVFILGCKGITEVDESKTLRRDSQIFAGTNKALVYEDNPLMLDGSRYFNSFNITDSLTPGFITSNNYLETKCDFKQSVSSSTVYTDTTENNCLKVLNDSSTTTQAIQAENQSWNFTPYTDEFYQVNLFYHMNQVQQRFSNTLSFIHKQVHFDSNMTIPPATKYNMMETGTHWLTNNGASSTLVAYSKCLLSPLNAFFSPSDNTLCFGYNDTFAKFRMVQDPTIIYHEFGHALVKIMMNQRNVTSGLNPITFNPYYSAHSFASDLGSISYDEAGALNEGIADYFSYYMNGREKIGEWGLGAFYAEAFHGNSTGKHRPMSENDSAHTADVSTQSGERLSYPQFLHYDMYSNIGESPLNVEDIHNAGMIVSHYLVALTKELKNQCNIASTDSDVLHQTAANYVMLLLNETMAEIGDLTGKGSDLFNEYTTLDNSQDEVYFTNLNEDQSFLWTQLVNPPNFRRFFRIFGKNILHYISTDMCPGFSLDESEQLLDDYGLLLFKSYEDRGNGLDASNSLAMSYFNYNGKSVFAGETLTPFILNTKVNEDNRRNTVLISKDLISLDEDVIAYVFDNQTKIAEFLTTLTFEGENVTTTAGIAGTEYNNGNTKISPGEVVGISLNLFNNSNSIMGGVQVLANDWDHMKLNIPSDAIYSDGNPANDPPYNYINRDSNTMALGAGTISGYKATHAPCIIDNFPTETQGGVTDTTSTTPGSCSYISRTNDDIDLTTLFPKHELDAPQPVCMVEFRDENETRWVSQEFFRAAQMNLEDKDCLNNPSMSGNNFNPNECLIRVLPGANQSVLGKINAGKTWAETMQVDTDQNVKFSTGNIFVMEVNKWIPPGTRFNCRVRVRFSNCIDCFNNNNTGDDFTDFQYGGHAPYKIINFQYTVSD